MKIDTSIPNDSIYSLYLDLNIRYGARHIALSFCSLLSIEERVYHFIIGLLEMIPGLGHLMAYSEALFCDRIKLLILDADTPYGRGLQHGQALKSEIKIIYSLVLNLINERRNDPEQSVNFERKVETLQSYLSDDILAEMQGLAKGADVELEDVFSVHAFLDIYAGEYGCSVLAARFEGDHVAQRIATTNHFAYDVYRDDAPLDSMDRERVLNSFPISSTNHIKALEEVNRVDTIQSIVFNSTTLEIEIASAWGSSATANFKKFPREKCFPNSNPVQNNHEVKLGRNLDWPWKALGPYTVVILTEAQNKQRFANITFPGYMGCLSGMNESGVALACCQAGNTSGDGLLVTLLFRKILEEATSAQEAIGVISENSSASSMNLTISDPHEVLAVEINPVVAKKGYSMLRRPR